MLSGFLFVKFSYKPMQLLWLTLSSIILMWVVFMAHSALDYCSNASWWRRLWIEANERHGCCQEEMGSSGIFYPKITQFYVSLSKDRWVSKKFKYWRFSDGCVLSCTLVLKDWNVFFNWIVAVLMTSTKPPKIEFIAPAYIQNPH